MKLLPEKIYYFLYKLSVDLKAASSVVEIIMGILLYAFPATTINYFIFLPFGDEIADWPLNRIHGFSPSTQAFWAFTLLSHGIVKVVLAVGLLKKKLWAYPSAAGVFGFFVIYQLRQMTFAPSAFLTLITIFDIILIGLIVHEYRRALKLRHLAK